MFVWQTNAGDTIAGPCKLCQSLNGQREGTSWSRNPAGEQFGPPPLHPHCACTIVWRNAEASDFREWLA